MTCPTPTIGTSSSPAKNRRFGFVYWTRKGRWSIDAVVVAATLGGLVVLGLGFWRDFGRAIGRAV
jgi:hypothetical protein